MNEAGKGFKIFRMGEVQDGRLIDTGRMKYADISHQEFEQYKLHTGDVLFNRTNSFELVGKTGIFALEGDYCFASYLVRLNLDRKKVLPEFLNYFMNSDPFQKSVKTKASKSINQANINATILSNELVSFPESLPEQQRIVGILDEAFDGIATAKANAEKNLQNARALFESVLNIAIQGELIPQNPDDASVADLMSQIEKLRRVAINQGRAKPVKTSPIEIDNGEQIELPKTWKWAQLECLTVAISDGVHKKPEYAADGVPFITVKNLTAGPGICFEDLNYITRADHEDFIKRTHPEKGDILVTKDGTIGVVRLIETDIEFSIFVSVALIKPVMRELGPYLVYALRASCVQSQIVPQGAALKHLYLVDLRRLAIPIPPLSEQRRIVARLDTLAAETQRLESLYQEKLVKLDDLKKSLLHQAFSGQL